MTTLPPRFPGEAGWFHYDFLDMRVLTGLFFFRDNRFIYYGSRKLVIPSFFENRSTILPYFDAVPLVDPEIDVANCIESDPEE